MAILSVSRVLRTVLSRRAPPPELPPRTQEEIEELRAVVDGVMSRLERLEEERDFYRDLLDAPNPARELEPPTLEPGVGGRPGSS